MSWPCIHVRCRVEATLNELVGLSRQALDSPLESPRMSTHRLRRPVGQNVGVYTTRFANTRQLCRPPGEGNTSNPKKECLGSGWNVGDGESCHGV